MGIAAKAQTDWELWNTINISGKLSDKFKVGLEGEDRYSHEIDGLRYFHYDVGFMYEISNKFTVGGFYREIYANKEKLSTRVSVPHIDVIYKEPIGFKLRTRVEYQMFQEIVLENQFRLRIRPAWQFHFWNNFNPFIQSELFISEKHVLTRNRFGTGLEIKLGKKVVIQPTYVLESNNKDIWANRHVGWFNTKFKF